MSERFTASVNVNDSKNTRLPVAEEFHNYRFGRDALAHVFRYLWVCEQWMAMAKELGRPIRVLEIGCGDIYTVRTFVSSFVVRKTDVIAEYTGLDIDDKSIARTRATAPKSLPIKLFCGDFTTGFLARFPDSSFDLVVNLEVIEHVKPEFVPPLLSEIRRLAPRAIISTPNGTGGCGKLPADHIKEWDTLELQQAMAAAGLRVDKRIGTFCQLNKARKYLQGSEFGQQVWAQLEATCPADLLSIAAARFAGDHAQNYVYEVSAVPRT